MVRKMQDNLVSVIIPTYNSEKYIDETLNSVLAQTYREFEIIIIDDCSKDNTWEIIKEYEKKYNNIVCLKQERNKGVAEARNRGINKATGRYIAFLDSDDLWDKEKLEKQIKLLKNTKEAVTCTKIRMINEKGEKLNNKCPMIEKISFNFLLRNTIIATSSVMIDREKIEKIKFPDRRSTEDYSLWLNLLKKHDIIGSLEELTFYRKTSNSLSSNKFKEIIYFYDVQVKDQQIKRIKALTNTFYYIVNAFKKHYL